MLAQKFRARRLYLEGNLTIPQICEKCNVKPTTFYRWVSRYDWYTIKKKIFERVSKRQMLEIVQNILDNENEINAEINRRYEYIKDHPSDKPKEDIEIIERLDKLRRLNKGEATDKVDISITDLNKIDAEAENE